MKIYDFFLLWLLSIEASMLSESVLALDCYAITKIRVDDKRPPEYAIDSCMPNPQEDICVTDYASRINVEVGYSALIQLCDDYCKSRDVSCSGYIIPAYWIDPYPTVLPHDVFSALKVAADLTVPEEKADCICLKTQDVEQNVQAEYSTVKLQMLSYGRDDIFIILNTFVTFWALLISLYVK